MILRANELQVQEILLDSIDWENDAFALRYAREAPADLGASLARVGMLNPPILTEAASSPLPLPSSSSATLSRSASRSPFAIVCGFARLHAWRALGENEVAVRIAPAGTPPQDLFYLSIEDNRQGRGFNIIEQAIALEKLASCLSQAQLVAEALPQLGLNPAPAVLERLLGYRALSPGVQRALALGDITESLVPILRSFEWGEQEALLGAMLGLGMSVGACRDCGREALEICKRDHIEMCALLEELGFERERLYEPWELPQVRSRFLDALRARRYPMLSRLNDDYVRTHKALALGDEVRIRPPKDFEGERYALEARLSNAEDLERIAGLLTDRLETRRDLVERLFDVRWEE